MQTICQLFRMWSASIWALPGEETPSNSSHVPMDVTSHCAGGHGSNALLKRRSSKDEIAVAGWPERTNGDVGDHEIEQSIRRLRLRIEEDASQPQYIQMVRGTGTSWL